MKKLLGVGVMISVLLLASTGAYAFGGGTNINTNGNANQNTNKNLNANLNANKNVNVNNPEARAKAKAKAQASASQRQGQLQGQAQLQGQGQFQGQAAVSDQTQGQAQTAISEGSFSSSVNSFRATIDGGETIVEDSREFHSAPAVVKPQTGSVNHEPEEMQKTRGYMSMSQMRTFLQFIELPEGIQQNQRVERTVATFQTQKVSRTYYPKKIKILDMSTRATGSRPIEVVSFRAKKDGVTSAEMAIEAARYCSRIGSDKLLLINQTRGIYAKASGWGVGLNYSGAGISDSNEFSQVGGGGTGYSSNQAFFEYRLNLDFACME